jgi:hypothetical protein
MSGWGRPAARGLARRTVTGKTGRGEAACHNLAPLNLQNEPDLTW